MKKYLIILITIIAIQFSTSNAMLTYEIPMDIISINKIERFPGHVITDVQPYLNGGLIFTYPAGLFTTNPVIHATILTALHASNITYTVEVCLESSSAATIMVYKNTAGVLTEAASSEVNVYFVAIGI